MKENLSRIADPRMDYFREIYKLSRMWQGESLKNKTIIVYCEQGFGDIIQFSRYFHLLEGKVLLHCPPQLHRLFRNCLLGNFELLDKYNPNLPPHDYYVLSMSLPFFLEDDNIPYITINEKEELQENLKIGIAWEGSLTNPNNHLRSCPLKYFKSLPGTLYMCQKSIITSSFIEDCDNLELYSIPIGDFYDLAKLINSVDYTVSVDTATLHLSSSMNKPTYGLLNIKYDQRWKIRNWYKSLMLFKGENWETILNHVSNILKKS